MLLRTAITSHLHYGIGLILSVLGLFFIGLSEDEDDNSKHLSTLLAGRGLQGFGYGYFISFCTISPNLDHHLFREDTATDGQRKMITASNEKLLTKDRTNLIGNESPIDFSVWVDLAK